MLFATPKFFINAIVAAHKLGWKPQVYIASVSIEPTIMGIARFNAPELTKGALSIAFVKNPNDPIWAKDPAVALYRSIMRKYDPTGKPTDVYNWYGMTVAWTMVETLRKAGKNLTRAGLLKAAQSLDTAGEPVHAAGHPPEDVADGLPADASRCTCTATTTSSGSRRAASSRRGDDRHGRCDRLGTSNEEGR